MSLDVPLSPRFEDILFAHVRELGRYAIGLRSSNGLSIETKSGPEDLVTVADKSIEAELIRVISEYHPEDSILGEESDGKIGTSDQSWILDPIDGTYNFSHNRSFWSISVGRVRDALGQSGLVYFPDLDQLFCAHHGQGATLNGETLIRPDLAVPSLGHLRVAAELSKFPEAGQALDDNLSRVSCLRCATADVVRVILGELDVYIHPRPTVYDYGAIGTIAIEAGCFVAGDLKGTPLTYDQKDPGPLVVCGSAEMARMLTPFFQGTVLAP